MNRRIAYETTMTVVVTVELDKDFGASIFSVGYDVGSIETPNFKLPLDADTWSLAPINQQEVAQVEDAWHSSEWPSSELI